MTPREVRIWIKGQAPRKSNNRVIYRNPRTGHSVLAKSVQARVWVQDALAQIMGDMKQSLGSASRPLCATFYVFYKDKRPDLSVELVLDTLEQADVISNDRHVYGCEAVKLFSKKLQGVYCIIRETDGPRWTEDLARLEAEEDAPFAQLLDDALRKE